ncbi:MAG: plasmid stabilization protein [Dehalococcoidia bacterium]|nr:plasmid stabilization protein [Dehalococcoidia bacterium]
MNSIKIDNLEDRLALRLAIRASESGRSVEEEAREILRTALQREASPERGLGTALHNLFKPIGGVDLKIPEREPMREPPRFG